MLRIAFFNIKKRKGATISLTILIILASLFFDIGANISTSISDFFYNKSEELQGPHYVALFENNKYSPSYLQFFKEDERVAESETQEVIYMDSAEWSNNDEKIPFPTIIQNMDNYSTLSGYKIIESREDLKDDGVYIPVSLKGFGYKTGDTLKITFKNQDHTYKVAGFYESTVFGTRTCGIFKIYLKNEQYSKIYNKVGGAKLISARMKDSYMSELVSKDFDTIVKSTVTSTDQAQSIITITYDEFSVVNVIMANLIAAFLMIFSFVIVFICLLVVRFNIKNDIKENLINIGTLEAIGFKSSEISIIYILEFMTISLAGTFIGALLSYAAMPLLSRSITTMVGAEWVNSLHIGMDLIMILMITSLILLISYICASTVKKYTPVIAFNGGIESHNFKKDYFKLSNGRFNINVNLALKGFISSFHQNIVIGIIIAVVTVAAIFCTVLYTNFAKDYKALTKIVGFEMSSLEVTTTKKSDCLSIESEISKMSQVRKTNILDSEKVRIDGNNISVQVCGDFKKLETLSVYEGSFPQYDNEVVVTGVFAESLNKSIGDSVIVECGGYSRKYIISGLTQSLSNGGNMAFFGIEEIKYVIPGYSPRTIIVYLNNEEDREEVVHLINEKFGNFAISDDRYDNKEYSEIYKIAKEKIENAIKLYDVDSIEYAVMAEGNIIASGSSGEFNIEKIQDIRNVIDSSIGPIINVISELSVVITIATMLIIVLILSLMIKAMIIKRKVEFGIFKAIGYTTRDLMFQIALSFMPTVICGTAVGTIGGIIIVNPLLTNALHIIGISKYESSVNINIVLAVNIFIIVFTFIVAMFDSYKVRKVSVYELLSE